MRLKRVWRWDHRGLVWPRGAGPAQLSLLARTPRLEARAGEINVSTAIHEHEDLLGCRELALISTWRNRPERSSGQDHPWSPPHPVRLPKGARGRLSRHVTGLVPSPCWGEGQGEGASVRPRCSRAV